MTAADSRSSFPSTGLTLKPVPVEHFSSIFTHSINGLFRDGLTGEFAYGGVDHLKKAYPAAASAGLVVEPNFAGAELFLWAVGEENPDGHKFLALDLRPCGKAD